MSFNGHLADDMVVGGKRVQTLVIYSWKKSKVRLKDPLVIIASTSVLF